MKILLKSFKFGISQRKFTDNLYKNITLKAYSNSGALEKLCSIFSKHGVNIAYLRTHCENVRKDKAHRDRLEISVDAHNLVNYTIARKELQAENVRLIEEPPIKVPWFPRTIQELDFVNQVILESDEAKDTPQYQDQEYRARRDEIASKANQYKMGEKIPTVDYSYEEHELWRAVYKKLDPLHKEIMCQQYLFYKEQFCKELNISDHIPQLDNLSNYLKTKSGFVIKPVVGIITQRQFLNCLAFKVFCSSQFIRHVKHPDYSPEPDIIHQIMGHVPMLSDPQIAELSQMLGLLSLGASDEEISKIGALYMFTIEFGICRENGNLKAYGAGITGSYGQIEYILGRIQQKPRFEELNVFRDCYETYPIRGFQPVFKVTDTFSAAISQLEMYGKYSMKPITTVFNERTNSINYDRCIIATEDDKKRS